MLSESQQKDVWQGWLSSEMRANYFADMSNRYAFFQRFLTWAALLFSSGAAVAILADASFPRNLNWIKPALALLTAGVCLFSLVQQYPKRSYDCSDLHFKWNRLANEYEALWNNVYADNAVETLNKLKEKSAEISRSSTAIPYHKRIMEKWEDHVIQHRVPQQTAA